MNKDVVQVKTITGDEAFQQALLKEPPKPFSWRALVLYLCALVAFCCSTCNGFDGSMFNSLLAMNQFKTYFSVANDGAWTGIIASMYQIGSVVALPSILGAGKLVYTLVLRLLCWVLLFNPRHCTLLILMLLVNLWAEDSCSAGASLLWHLRGQCMSLRRLIRHIEALSLQWVFSEFLLPHEKKLM